MNDTAIVYDCAVVEKLDPPIELLKNWKVTWTCEKWHKSEDHLAGLQPDEIVSALDNGLLNNGIDNLLLRLIGGPSDAYPAYASGSAVIVVGNSNTGFSAAHTDLQGTQAESTMDAGYPTVAAQVVTWKATFITSAANFAWEEVGVKNQTGAVSATKRLLNRKVQSFGTKVSGAVWTMTLAITVS